MMRSETLMITLITGILGTREKNNHRIYIFLPFYINIYIIDSGNGTRWNMLKNCIKEYIVNVPQN